MIDLRDRPALTALPFRVLTSALVLFAVVALLAIRTSVVPGDQLVLDAIQTLPSTPFDIPLNIGNRIGDTIAGPIAVIILAALCAYRRFVPGIVFCIALLVFRLSGMYLKRVFDSPRPGAADAEIRGHFDGLGFPSGHAMTSFSIALAATIILPALFRKGGTLRVCLGGIWTLAALCGIARVWYGAHWPTDVIGGAAVATSMVWASAWIARKYQDHRMNTATPTTRTPTESQRSATSR